MTAAARAERLVNLVLCLLSSRQYLPAERIRRTVPGYADAPSDEAFFRMFERDKAELRELGVPLETGPIPGFEAGDGYRIARLDYELPYPELARAGLGHLHAIQALERQHLVDATLDGLAVRAFHHDDVHRRPDRALQDPAHADAAHDARVITVRTEGGSAAEPRRMPDTDIGVEGIPRNKFRLNARLAR